MALELRQKTEMKQQLRMTPQLQQAIKLLQLSRMELIAEVRQEMVENPVLEEIPDVYDADAVGETGDDESSEEMAEVQGDESDMDQVDWEEYMEKYSSPPPGNHYKGMRGAGDDFPTLEQTLSTSESLTEDLLVQLRLEDLDDHQQHIGALIIGNLDEAGLLKNTTVDEIAQDAEAPVGDVDEMLELIQSFDPPGIAARDLEECLLIQAERSFPDHELLHNIIRDHISDLERKSYSKISRIQNVDKQEVIDATRLLRELEPRPAGGYSDDEARYITPDIYIRKYDGEWIASLNEDGLPKLRISNFYRQELAKKKEEGEDDEVKDYIQEKMRGAMWLIRSIHQRQSTIMKVTESIIDFQKEFFEQGVQHLKPLVLKDVAEDIEMHESTVSRVTTNKYVHTPRGVFELKFFFNSSISRDGAGDLASEAVKAKIRDIIADENPEKPLSDSKIADALEDRENIDIARRTVAKYREKMGILSSSKRKDVF